MRRPNQPVIVDAKITEEYVICGACLTRNRVVSHKKALRPVCGCCGHSLPDPFGAQPRIHSFGKRITRNGRFLAAIAGLLLLGLFAWLVREKNAERWSVASAPSASGPGTTSTEYRGEPVDAISFTVRDGTSRATPESIKIVIELCAGAVHELQAGGGCDGAPAGVSVYSDLEPRTGDTLSPSIIPHVVEQIHIDAALDMWG